MASANRLLVRECGGFLDPDLRLDERGEWTKPADREILNGAKCLDAVERIGGDFECAERVLFGSGLCGHREMVRSMSESV
jgi:hypothetical protein